MVLVESFNLTLTHLSLVLGQKQIGKIYYVTRVFLLCVCDCYSLMFHFVFKNWSLAWRLNRNVLIIGNFRCKQFLNTGHDCSCFTL